MQTNVCDVKHEGSSEEILRQSSEKSSNTSKEDRKRFSIQRTVTSGKGISAYVELFARNIADAEEQVTALFAHEESTATYAVRRVIP